MLKDKVIVITGASSGIGEALAIETAQQGAAVILGARREDRLENVVTRIRTTGGTATSIVCDVTDRAQAEALINSAMSAHGRLDILVNNAGSGHFSSIEDTTDEMIDHMLAVNVAPLWYTCRPALHIMKRQGNGHIINIASMAGKIGFPFNSAYVAAKYACVGFTHALRVELMETGIHATVVCPAGVKTDWANLTEGGPIREIFSEAGPLIKRIAQERNLPLPKIEGVLSPEAVAKKIVECMHHPVAELYTHRGAAEFASLAASHREEAERYQLAVVLGEREVYQRLKS